MGEGIIGLIIVIFAVIVAANQKKTGSKGGKAPAAHPAQPLSVPVQPPAKPVEAKAPWALPLCEEAAAPVFDRQTETFSISAPRMGREGEDACHEYLFQPQEEAPAFPHAPENERARELVRGVILSEILARPRPRRYGRRA